MEAGNALWELLLQLNMAPRVGVIRWTGGATSKSCWAACLGVSSSPGNGRAMADCSSHTTFFRNLGKVCPTGQDLCSSSKKTLASAAHG